MIKHRLALGLTLLTITTIGLYAVLDNNANIIQSKYASNENYEAVKANIVDSNNLSENSVRVIEEVKETLPAPTLIPQPKDERDVKVTAYTLSKAECGKNPWDRGYGITRGGEDLRNKDWKSARAIAVDPNVIPLHSVVMLEFYDEKYQIYSGEYRAIDSGSAIKGNRIDLFYSEFDSTGAINFGIADCKMTIIKYGE